MWYFLLFISPLLPVSIMDCLKEDKKNKKRPAAFPFSGQRAGALLEKSGKRSV